MNFKTSTYSIILHLFPVILGIILAIIILVVRHLNVHFTSELILILAIIITGLILPYLYILFNHLYFSSGKSFTIEDEFKRFSYHYQNKVYKFGISDISGIQIVGSFTRGFFVPGLIFKYVKININNGNQFIVTSLMMPQMEDLFTGETVKVNSFFPYLSMKSLIIKT